MSQKPITPGTGPKIDIHAKTPDGWRYLCSTNWSRTCKEAVERYQQSNPSEIRPLRAWFAKPRKRIHDGRCSLAESIAFDPDAFEARIDSHLQRGLAALSNHEFSWLSHPHHLLAG